MRDDERISIVGVAPVVPSPTADAFQHALFDAMPQLGWTARADGYIDHYNRGWYEYTGKDFAEMQGWGWTSVHHPEHLARVIHEWRGAIESGRPAELLFPLRRHDGEFRWFLTRVVPLHDVDGRLARWVGINTDIHDQKVAEHALRELGSRSEEAAAQIEAQRILYQGLFEHAPVAIALLTGPEHVVALANPLICKAWGRTAAHVLGKPVCEALPEIRAQGFVDLLDGVLHTGTRYIGTEIATLLPRDIGGSLEPAYFNFVYEPMRDRQGKPEGIIIVAVDVTAQVLARVALEERAKQSAFSAAIGVALTDNNPLDVQLRRCCDATVELGAAFARIWIHDASERVLRLAASSGLYTHLDGSHALIRVGEYKIGRIAQERQPHLTNAVQTDPMVGDPEWARREGMVSFAGYPLLLGDRLVGVLGLFARAPLSEEMLRVLQTASSQIALAIERDSTERFRETFLGMLGHDLRNPLSAISTAAQLINVSAAVPERPRNAARRIVNSAGRMSRMVDQLLDYTRTQAAGGIPINAARANFAVICKDALEELQHAHPDRRIELSSAGSFDGEFDIDRMAQVFSNLIGNAIAYGSAGAPIKITLRDDQGCFQGEVVSYGAQIPEADLPRVFDRFKRASNHNTAATTGLGLGLFITREIIRAHGGAIEAVSLEGDGTSFRFWIPRTKSNTALLVEREQVQ